MKQNQNRLRARLLKLCSLNHVHVNISKSQNWKFSIHNPYTHGIFIGCEGIDSKMINPIIAHELSHDILKHEFSEFNVLRNELEAWKKAFQLLNLEENFDRDTLEFAQKLLNEYFFNHYWVALDNVLEKFGFELHNKNVSRLHHNNTNGVASRKKMSKKESKTTTEPQILSELRKSIKMASSEKERLILQRELWNRLPMKSVLKYRAQDGTRVEIWRPKCPKPLKRVI